MDTTNSTSEYLLLFRGSKWDRSLSPAELQKTMAAFVGWFERLSAEGTVKAGQPLMDDSRIVSGKNGRIVADGPFAESKEAIGGYFIVNADSFDEAVTIAQGCPILEHGTVVEVRPIAASCPTFQRVQRTIDESLQPVGA
jgi:hypothetical protein